MFPAAQGDGRRVKQELELVVEASEGIARTTEFFAWGGLAYPSHFFESARLKAHPNPRTNLPPAEAGLVHNHSADVGQKLL